MKRIKHAAGNGRSGIHLGLWALIALSGCQRGKMESAGPGTGGRTADGTGGSFSRDAGVVILDPSDGGVAQCGSGDAAFRTTRTVAPNLPTETQVEPPPPVSGGTLIVLGDGVTAVAADPDRDAVYVVDLTDLQAPRLRSTIPLQRHDEPGRLIEDGAGRVHVILRRAGALVTLDPRTGTTLLRREVCAVPRGLAYDPQTDRLHVACAGGQLATLAPMGAQAERMLALKQDLRDVVVDGSRLLVSRFRTAEVLVVDADGALVERVAPAKFTNAGVRAGAEFEPSVAWRMVRRPGGGAAMIHQRGMHGKIDQRPGAYGGPGCEGIVHTAVTVVRSDGAAPAMGPALPSFVLPVDLALSPDGTRVAMVAAGNGHLSGPLGSQRLFVGYTDDVTLEWATGCGNDGRHGPSGRCISSTMGARVVTGTGEIGGAGGAMGSGGTAGTTGGTAAGGTSGTGGRVASSTCVDVPVDVEPTAVAFAGATVVIVQSRQPARLWVAPADDAVVDSTPWPSVVLSDDSRADLGHAIFHTNSGGGLACASCHPEGHEDGRVWSFACDGDRRTQDVGGGLMGTQPFHWSGDLVDFDTLVRTVFVGRMSGVALSTEQSAAMMRWIDAVPAFPAPRNTAEAQVARGKALFEDPAVACASCHNGALLTNNATVDVGTSALFQVPALRGLAWRAPYMHNGCAPDLRSRFAPGACGGGDQHGKTSHLSADQLEDLIAYLESI